MDALADYDFEVGGIYYNIVEYDNTVTVTNGSVFGDLKSYEGNIVIPSEVTYDGTVYPVTAIDDIAFRNSGITSIIIPPSVKKFGFGTFAGCDKLEAVYISDLASWCGSKFESSGSNPLCNGCELYVDGEQVLGQLVIPAGVTSISDYAFYNSDMMTSLTIPSSVTNIGSYAFSFSHIMSLSIPSSVTYINDCAFYKCPNLKSVTIPASVEFLSGTAFQSCQSLTDLVIEDSDKPLWMTADAFKDTPVTTMYLGRTDEVLVSYEYPTAYVDSYSAFSEMPNLTRLVIGPKVKYIYKGGFSDCPSLTELTIADSDNTLRCFGDDYKETALETLYVGRDVVNISFRYAPLRELVFSNNVTEISHYFVRDCPSLTSITLPPTVTEIGEDAFEGCSGLSTVNISDIGAWCGIKFYDEHANPTVAGAGALVLNGATVMELVIPEGVSEVSSYAFYNNTNLTSVTVPASVGSVGDGAFKGCANLKDLAFADAAAAVTIGNDAFGGCLLENVRLGRSLDVGYCPFAGMESLKTVEFGGYGFDLVGGFFAGCTGIEGVYIEDLPSWCSMTFGDADANPLTYAHNLYCGGELVTQAELSPARLNDYAFCGASCLEDVRLQGVQQIGCGVFNGCTGLKAVSLDEVSTLTIEDDNEGGLFADSDLETVYLGCDLDYTISPFVGQAGITDLKIGEGVSTIGDNAFDGCEGITEVTLPASVNSVGKSAFRECFSIIAVNSLNPVPPVADITSFENLAYILGTLTVPEGSSSSYRSAEGWENFYKVVEKDFPLTGIATAPSAEGSVKVSVSDGRIVVEGATASTPVAVYDLSGKLVYTGVDTTVALPAGTYVVRVACKSSKVCVF